MKNILVLGRGGREAAQTLRLANEGHQVYCAPGNPGIAEFATCIPITEMRFPELIDFAHRAKIDFVLPGPEAPLIGGVADQFAAAGIPTCGPSKAAAFAEFDKGWFKGVIAARDIPTAPYFEARSIDDARTYVRNRGHDRIVLKGNGEWAGKGVVLPQTINEANEWIQKLMRNGAPGERLVIEDRIHGVERSAIALTDGTNVVMFPYTQDYKTVSDIDLRNTGGMASHTIDVPPELVHIMRNIVVRIVEALRDIGRPYRGIIYIGFMITKDGLALVLECNCRGGDPEMQAILASMDVNFAELCYLAASGSLTGIPDVARRRHAFNLVLTSPEYPNKSKRDDPIVIDDQLYALDNVVLLHAGTGKSDSGEFTTAGGGRLMNLIATAPTLPEARDLAYRAQEFVQYPGKKFRLISVA